MRIRPRTVLRIQLLLLIFVLSSFVLAFVFVSRRPHSGHVHDHGTGFDTFHLDLVDDFLDEALDVSLSNTRIYQDGRPRVGPRLVTGARGADDPGASRHGASTGTYRFPLVSSALQADVDTLRAQVCRILRGKSLFLVGPHETLYQLHSYLLTVLQPDPTPSSTMAPTTRSLASCPGDTLSYSCPSHPLCHSIMSTPPSSFHSGSDTNYDSDFPTLAAEIRSANASSDSTQAGSLLRFLNSGNLNPSQAQEDSDLPSFDPRTGVRITDSRWVRYAASSKADILVLNRGPLPAPAWSYNKSVPQERTGNLNLTWLTTLRALEQKHADSEPLSDLFAGVLSRLDSDYHHDVNHILVSSVASSEPDTTTKLVMDAALHSTISTFLPSVLSTLSRLRNSEHAGRHHRPTILETKKPVLWYGSWFLPVSCAPESLFVFSSESDPRYLLARLLSQAATTNNPWSAYYNAQVYMHDRLLARLLPAYGISYISSLFTISPPPEIGQTYHQGERWTCIRRVFETPRGLLMGQIFLRDFIDALGSWNWSNV